MQQFVIKCFSVPAFPTHCADQAPHGSVLSSSLHPLSTKHQTRPIDTSNFTMKLLLRMEMSKKIGSEIKIYKTCHAWHNQTSSYLPSDSALKVHRHRLVKCRQKIIQSLHCRWHSLVGLLDDYEQIEIKSMILGVTKIFSIDLEDIYYFFLMFGYQQFIESNVEFQLQFSLYST